MVTTRGSLKKTCPTAGVPTHSGQARKRAEHAEQRSAAAQANAPAGEEARRSNEEEELLQLDGVDDDDA